MNIKGKVAIITGGSRGLGKAFAEDLLKKGAKVVITGVCEETGAATLSELAAKYGADSINYMRADVATESDMTRVFDETVRMHGRVNILINNAGVSTGHPRLLEININGVILCSELGLKYMKADQRLNDDMAVIVNMSSIAGLKTAWPGSQLYQTSKHAVIGYSGAIAEQYAREGIRVVVLCPGFTKTDLNKRYHARPLDDPTNPVVMNGGWVRLEDVVATCAKMIESEKATPGMLVKVTSAGSKVMHPELMPEEDFFEL